MPVYYGEQRSPQIDLANLDKITLHIKNAFLLHLPDIDTYNLFKTHLSQSQLFTGGRAARSNIFSVRKREAGLGQRWLFGGNAKFTGRVGAYSADLNLELNPTRLIHHLLRNAGNAAATEDAGRQIINSYLVNASPDECLECNPHDNRAEVGTLDGNDNIIPARSYRYMRPCLDIFGSYYQQVLSFIRIEIEGAARLAMGAEDVSLAEDFTNVTLSHLEVFWEYSVSDAVSFVNGLQQHINPRFTTSQADIYRIYSRIVDGNSPCLRLNRGSKHVELKVYAKTADRVRFEIAYLKNVRTLLGRIRASDLPEGINRAPSIIGLAIPHARALLSTLVKSLPELDYSEVSSFQSLVGLLNDIASACHSEGNPYRIKQVLGLLLSNGAIQAPVGSHEDAVCQRLVKQRLLTKLDGVRNARGSVRYILATKHQNAFQAILRALGSGGAG